MRTLNTKQAARLLGIHPDTYCERCAAGLYPAVKEGKEWVAVDVDLIQYLRSKYRQPTDTRGTPWGSTSEKAAATGGTASRSKVARQYDQALAPATGKPQSRRRPSTSAACGSSSASG